MWGKKKPKPEPTAAEKEAAEQEKREIELLRKKVNTSMLPLRERLLLDLYNKRDWQRMIDDADRRRERYQEKKRK